jgi:hypothetical protein
VLYATSIIPLGEGHGIDVQQFGRYGIIILSSLNSDNRVVSDADRNDEAYICGGVLASGRLTVASPRFFRLRPEHHRLLVTELGRLGLPILCHFVGASQVSSSVSLAPPEFPLVPTENAVSRVTALAAIAAPVVAPFVLMKSAEASENLNGCVCSVELFTGVRFDQLAALEGGTQVYGHVPDDASGVNIAAGLDLGLTTRQDLVDMGFGEDHIQLLNRYLARSKTDVITGSRARNILASAPLEISPELAQQINHLVFSWHANSVASHFNHEVERRGALRGITFASLPSRFQTAMANMFLVDQSFVRSDAFAKFASGLWLDGMVALDSYPSPKPAVIARAKLASFSLSKVAKRMPAPNPLGESV